MIANMNGKVRLITGGARGLGRAGHGAGSGMMTRALR
jgi:hypothetical protein